MPLGKYRLTWNVKAELVVYCTVKRGKRTFRQECHGTCRGSEAVRRRPNHERRDLQKQWGCGEGSRECAKKDS